MLALHRIALAIAMILGALCLASAMIVPLQPFAPLPVAVGVAPLSSPKQFVRAQVAPPTTDPGTTATPPPPPPPPNSGGLDVTGEPTTDPSTPTSTGPAVPLPAGSTGATGPDMPLWPTVSPWLSTDPNVPTVWGGPDKDGVDPNDPYCKWQDGMMFCI